MHRRLIGVLSAAVVALGAFVPAASAAPAPRAACPDPGPGLLRCLTTYTSLRALADGPAGWGADDLAAAYGLPSDAGPDTLVGISIAYDAPNLEADLAAYRAQYGLPPCTTANGCFRKVNQQGAPAPLPAASFGWAMESTLDVSMVSAACPSCRILVVEGNTPEFADLAETEDTAVRLGASVVSNSYGARESGAPLAFASHYQHPGVTVVASSGDAGFTAASYPAVLPTTVAVGGTTLARDPSSARGWAESAWQYGGSGCSAYIAKPSWQKDTHCGKRTVADIASAAEDIAIHYTDAGGWLPANGTSASAPYVAGLIARSGHAGATQPSSLYAKASSFTDITAGTNDPTGGGKKCGNDYLCVAGPGYDAPTGVGVPSGLTGF
ncbi:S8 family serine peptidase [Amycolatopsis mongoliensis]|uniref:S8 family serine peptidase n=1 Tax=Amycolatopsis mongoliensis TaxID=715475 RepID=A0A9Y2NC78_9PSEU|nr:S8 family serine peptidase [Amycolatopsis sp. 4-36]WIX99296.1 S8 family serine peptidase [Amycolatopsis sp. 4-36]